LKPHPPPEKFEFPSHFRGSQSLRIWLDAYHPEFEVIEKRASSGLIEQGEK
jgi:hypothetical protein